MSISFTGYFGCICGLSFTKLSFEDFKQAQKHFAKVSISSDAINFSASIPKIELYAGIGHTIRATVIISLAYLSFSFLTHDLQTQNPK